MEKLSVFRRLLHCVLWRTVNTYNFMGVFGSWRPSMQVLINAPGFLTLYNDSFPAEYFFAQNKDISISVIITSFRC
jgi:hypothetical protein